MDINQNYREAVKSIKEAILRMNTIWQIVL